MARVSKLNGRKIKVSGNSLDISINTIRHAMSNGFFNIGKFKFKRDLTGLTLSVLEAKLILLLSFSILESMGCQATARKRTK